MNKKVVTYGKVFGHPVTWYKGEPRPRWDDDNTYVPKGADGSSMPDADHPCRACGKLPGPTGHDPCIDSLPGVEFACCGHGDKDQAYVAFDRDEVGNRRVIRGDEAIEYFKLVK